MRFLVQSMQQEGLTAEDTARLYRAMQAFYSDIPADVRLEADFIRADRKGSYSVLTVPDRAAIERVLAPFEGLVRVEVVALAE